MQWANGRQVSNKRRVSIKYRGRLLEVFFTARCYGERGYEIACRLSLCNDRVPWLEFFENNFTAK